MPGFIPRRALETPQVFSLRIDASLFLPGMKFDWLSEDEKRSLDAIGSAKRRAQFAAGRWLLHHAAREALGRAKYLVEVRDGRPVVTLEGARAPIAVSLSHAGDFVLCGVAPAGLLGVDAEVVRPRKQWEGLAEFALHPAERRRLAGLPEAACWERFYRTWTLKEALSKALGVGLAMPFNRIRLSIGDAEHLVRIEEAPAGHALIERTWNIRTLEAPQGMAAAVAWSEAAV